jgi:hypothetical protein
MCVVASKKRNESEGNSQMSSNNIEPQLGAESFSCPHCNAVAFVADLPPQLPQRGFELQSL